MKKLVAVMTVVAISSISMSAFAACGNNTGRNARTTPSAPTSGPAPTAPADGAGFARPSTLPR